MKNYSLTLILALVFGASSTYAANAVIQDSHSEHSSEKLALDHGNKWPIDISLHKGMTEIKALIAKNLIDIHEKKFTSQQYEMLAGYLQIQIDFIMENCALPAAADNQLHILLTGIMQGMEQMESGDKKRNGAILVIQALKNYPKYFNDTNWEEIHH